MLLSLVRAAASAAALLGLVSCAAPQEVTQLQQTVNTLQAQRQKDDEAMRRLEGDLRRAQTEIDWLTDQTAACKYREYGQRLKDSCEQGRCDPNNTNSALNKLKELPGSYVVLRLKPELGAEGLTRSHLDQIMELLLTKSARPTTRLMLLVLPHIGPHGDPQNQAQQASQVAVDLRDNIRKKLGHSRDFSWTTPTVVGCTKETKTIFYQFASLYSAQLAQKKMTAEKEPRPEDSLVAILFRLDCFASNYTAP